MDFKVDMKELENMVNNACVEALEDTATIAVGEIQAITPVGFGVLRRSITHDDVDKANLSVNIGSNIYYAPWVEEGYTQKEGQYVPTLGKKLTGKHIDGRWMIHDGITIAESQMEDMVKQKLEGAFRND